MGFFVLCIAIIQVEGWLKDLGDNLK